jgi:S1-C subfamily serine protease
MEFYHPYAKKLAERVDQRKDKAISIKARGLLNRFGYYKRTPGVISTIQSSLKSCGLSAELSTTFPVSLDDHIRVSRLVEETALGSKKENAINVHEVPRGSTDYINIAEKSVIATVDVYSDLGSGSGFIIHPEGLIVTARHVIEDDISGLSNRYAKVKLADDREYDSVVFRSHKQLDFALMWILGNGPFSVLPLGDSASLRFGETVFTVGSPAGLSKTVTRGIISNPNQKYGMVDCIQTDAGIWYGNSGGPLVNDKGVLGIVVGGHVDQSGQEVRNANFAIPLEYLKNDIAIAIEQGKEKCLDALYCQVCGNLDLGLRTWFCRNCGVEIVEKVKKIKKSQSIGELLDLCDEHTRTIYKHIIELWQKKGQRIQAGINGITLRWFITNKSMSAVSLRVGTEKTGAIMVLGWENFRREGIFKTTAIDLFQSAISEIFQLRITQSTAHILISEKVGIEQIEKLVEILLKLKGSQE